MTIRSCGSRSMWTPRAIFAGLAIALALVANPPGAAWGVGGTSPLELRWTAPPECPTATEVSSKLAERGRRWPRPERSGQKRADVEILRLGPDEWSARLEIVADGETTARTFAGKTCGAVADAATLLLVFLVDPMGGGEGGARASSPSPSAPSHPLVPEKSGAGAAEVAVPANDRRGAPAIGAHAAARPALSEAASWTARIDSTADVGSLPAASIGLAVTLGRRMGRLHAELSAAHWFARRQAFAAGSPQPGGDFDLTAGAVTACLDAWTSKARTLSLGGCATLEAGGLRGTSVDVTGVGTAMGLWLASGAGVRLAWRLLPWGGLSVRLDGVVPWLRPTYEITGLNSTFRSDRVAARAAAGLEVYF